MHAHVREEFHMRPSRWRLFIRVVSRINENCGLHEYEKNRWTMCNQWVVKRVDGTALHEGTLIPREICPPVTATDVAAAVEGTGNRACRRGWMRTVRRADTTGVTAYLCHIGSTQRFIVGLGIVSEICRAADPVLPSDSRITQTTVESRAADSPECAVSDSSSTTAMCTSLPVAGHRTDTTPFRLSFHPSPVGHWCNPTIVGFCPYLPFNNIMIAAPDYVTWSQIAPTANDRRTQRSHEITSLAPASAAASTNPKSMRCRQMPSQLPELSDDDDESCRLDFDDRDMSPVNCMMPLFRLPKSWKRSSRDAGSGAYFTDVM